MLLVRATIGAALLVGGCSAPPQKDNVQPQVAEDFVHFTGPDNQPLTFNPSGVILRPPRHPEHFAKGIRCIITAPSGQFITVKESCGEVEQKLKPFQ